MDLPAQLLAALTSLRLPPPSPSLLASLTTRSPPPPLPSLVATAKARLLAADLTCSPCLDAALLCAFPPGTDSANVKDAKLPHDTHVQLVDVENLSRSRWEQIEDMQAVESGQRTRGREVIRVADADDENALGPLPAGKSATHRLVVQDCRGMSVYAVELARIEGLGVGKTSIGCKMLLRAGTTVARGTVLLTPENCLLLGGKIEAWHETWMNGRMASLKNAAGNGNGDTTTTSSS